MLEKFLFTFTIFQIGVQLKSFLQSRSEGEAGEDALVQSHLASRKNFLQNGGERSILPPEFDLPSAGILPEARP